MKYRASVPAEAGSATWHQSQNKCLNRVFRGRIRGNTRAPNQGALHNIPSLSPPAFHRPVRIAASAKPPRHQSHPARSLCRVGDSSARAPPECRLGVSATQQPFPAWRWPGRCWQCPMAESFATPRSGGLLMELLVLYAMRLVGFLTQPLFALRLIRLIIALAPHGFTVAFESEYVRGDAVEEPAVVTDDHGAAAEVEQRFFQRP